MENLDKEEMKQLLLYYKQKSMDLEFNLLCAQLKLNTLQKNDKETSEVFS